MTPQPSQPQEQIQLSPDDSASLQQYFTACDEYAAGVRAGMEQAKRQFLKYLISQQQLKPKE